MINKQREDVAKYQKSQIKKMCDLFLLCDTNKGYQVEVSL